MGTPGRWVVLEDRRGENRYLRVTWHAETRTIVFSHWTEDICTASSRLALADSSKLIGFLVNALHDAATAPPARRSPAGPNHDDANLDGPNLEDAEGYGVLTKVLSAIRNLLRPRLAQVIPVVGRRSGASADLLADDK